MPEFMTYAESQRRKLCPYCGEQGVKAPELQLDDEQFSAYMCKNHHVFYIDKSLEQEGTAEGTR